MRTSRTLRWVFYILIALAIGVACVAQLPGFFGGVRVVTDRINFMVVLGVCCGLPILLGALLLANESRG